MNFIDGQFAQPQFIDDNIFLQVFITNMMNGHNWHNVIMGDENHEFDWIVFQTWRQNILGNIGKQMQIEKSFSEMICVYSLLHNKKKKKKVTFCEWMKFLISYLWISLGLNPLIIHSDQWPETNWQRCSQYLTNERYCLQKRQQCHEVIIAIALKSYQTVWNEQIELATSERQH